MNELLEKGSFAEALKKLVKKPEYAAAYAGFDAELYNKPIADIEAFLRNVELTSKDFAAVERLFFDGGNEIYQKIMPFWDGEDDYFDINSIDGFENLPNLREVFNISMIKEVEIARFRASGIVVK